MKPFSRVVLSNTYTMDDKVVIFGDFRADNTVTSLPLHRSEMWIDLLQRRK